MNVEKQIEIYNDWIESNKACGFSITAWRKQNMRKKLGIMFIRSK